MQIVSRPDLDVVRRTYSVQAENTKILQQQEKDRLDPITLKHFHESREHYKSMLDRAEPMGPDILTVPRINSLQVRNKALISFLAELYTTMKKDAAVDSNLNKYVTEINSFAENYKKL